MILNSTLQHLTPSLLQGSSVSSIFCRPKAWRSWKTGIVLGRVFRVWLSRAITTMAPEQVRDLAGPADTGINININMCETFKFFVKLTTIHQPKKRNHNFQPGPAWARGVSDRNWYNFLIVVVVRYIMALAIVHAPWSAWDQPKQIIVCSFGPKTFERKSQNYDGDDAILFWNFLSQPTFFLHSFPQEFIS